MQEALYQLCSDYRQNNEYCERLDLSRLKNSDYELDNRDGFNFSKMGTIEFRMKESVKDVDSILRWIKLTQKMVDIISMDMNKKRSEVKRKAETILDAMDKEIAIQSKDDSSVMLRVEKYMEARSYAKSIMGL